MSRPAPHANMPRLGIKARADTQARRALTGPGFGTALVIPQGRHRLWGTGVGGGASAPPTPFQARLNSDRGTAARRQAPRRTRAADRLRRLSARRHGERPQAAQRRAHAEPHDLHPLTAVLDASAPRAESALGSDGRPGYTSPSAISPTPGSPVYHSFGAASGIPAQVTSASSCYPSRPAPDRRLRRARCGAGSGRWSRGGRAGSPRHTGLARGG